MSNNIVFPFQLKKIARDAAYETNPSATRPRGAVASFSQQQNSHPSAEEIQLYETARNSGFGAGYNLYDGVHPVSRHLNDENALYKIYNINSLVTNISVSKHEKPHNRGVGDVTQRLLGGRRNTQVAANRDMYAADVKYNMLGRIMGDFKPCSSCPH
jgi:hypothetical protein